MQKRFNIKAAAPNALKAMIGLETYLSQCSISKTTKELIKIRASQINGCAFCINIHAQDAIKKGETNQRIFFVECLERSRRYFYGRRKSSLGYNGRDNFNPSEWIIR